MRQLDLLEVVDPDGIVMAFPSQKDLDEISQDAQLVKLLRCFQFVSGNVV